MRAASLLRRLRNAARYVVHGGVMPAEAAPTARVGLLNTGELIVLLAGGGHLVLASHTTDLVRDVLAYDSAAFDNAPLPVGFAGAAP
jgi:hypothetical protein